MISIVIPTKDEDEYLPILLKSLQNQSQEIDEIIVADAHSTDRTREIAREFGATVVDGGMPGPGRNRGAEVVTSEYILFLDADVDLQDPDFLKKNLEEMRQRDLGIATCDVLPLGENKLDQVNHWFYNRYIRLKARLANRFPKFAHAIGFCIFVKKEIHDQIGGFDETIVFAEDHIYSIEAAKVGKFGVLNAAKVPVSMRRFDRDGRLRMSIKMILSEIYIWIFGPIRTNIFNYTFGHKKEDK